MTWSLLGCSFPLHQGSCKSCHIKLPAKVFKMTLSLAEHTWLITASISNLLELCLNATSYFTIQNYSISASPSNRYWLSCLCRCSKSSHWRFWVLSPCFFPPFTPLLETVCRQHLMCTSNKLYVYTWILYHLSWIDPSIRLTQKLNQKANLHS